MEKRNEDSKGEKDYYLIKVNREKSKQHCKEFYKNNKEYFQKYFKEYNIKNKEQISEYNKKYYEANKEKKSAYAKKYNAKKKEEEIQKILEEEELPNIQDVEKLLKNEPIIQVEKINNQEKEEDIEEIYEAENFILAENYKTDLQTVNQEKEEIFKKYNSVLKDKNILANNNKILIDTVSKLRKEKAFSDKLIDTKQQIIENLQKRIEELSNREEKNIIKPIKTFYKGIEFRSRLEARWARFFDACGVRWDYEQEGYELGDGRRYLPDFLVHNVGIYGSEKKGIYFDIYFEVKGAMNQKDSEKIIAFSTRKLSENVIDTGLESVRLYEKPLILVGNIPQSITDMLTDNDNSVYKPAFYDFGCILPACGGETAYLGYKGGNLVIAPIGYGWDEYWEEGKISAIQRTEEMFAIARNEKFENRKTA